MKKLLTYLVILILVFIIGAGSSAFFFISRENEQKEELKLEIDELKEEIEELEDKIGEHEEESQDEDSDNDTSSNNSNCLKEYSNEQFPNFSFEYDSCDITLLESDERVSVDDSIRGSFEIYVNSKNNEFGVISLTEQYISSLEGWCIEDNNGNQAIEVSNDIYRTLLPSGNSYYGTKWDDVIYMGATACYKANYYSFTTEADFNWSSGQPCSLIHGNQCPYKKTAVAITTDSDS